MLENKEGGLELDILGLKNLKRIHRNLSTPVLYEEIIKNREGQIAHLGPVVVRTGNYTEKTDADKFIVQDETSEKLVQFTEERKGLSLQHYNTLFYRLHAYLQNSEVYVQDCYAGSDPEFRIPLRIVTERAWHNLFARNMYRQIHDEKELDTFKPEFTIIQAPGFQAIPEMDGTRRSSFVIINLAQKVALIGGTSYAGEVRQAVFTIVNYLLEQNRIFIMRAASNIGDDGDVAIFLGGSGAGKTALAIDPERSFLGDHFHGWSDNGLCNFEWGCYAKGINLTPDAEPDIYEATRKFGSILENVAFDQKTRRADLTDQGLTQNTRIVFPLPHVRKVSRQGTCGHPKNVFLVTCDAFGVVPLIARLTPELAAFAFMTAYTADLTQSDSGAVIPDIRFGITYGDAALNLPSHEYGKLFMEKIVKHNATCWVVNTGWVGEPFDKGERIDINLTRTAVRAAASGQLENVAYDVDPIFNYQIPLECPGIPKELMNPRTAAKDSTEYEIRANRLAQEFMKDMSTVQMPEQFRDMLASVISPDDQMDLVDVLGFSM